VLGIGLQSGCKTGPVITHYIADSEALWGGYVNEGRREWSASNLAHCVTAQALRRAYRTCKEGAGFGDVNRCIYYVDTDGLACSDGRIRSRAEVTNWTCFTGQDADELLRYCNRKQRDQ